MNGWTRMLATLLFTLLLAGCGSASSTASGSKATSDTVKVATVTVKGQPEKVLTTSSGLTLYYYKPDTSTKATCTGSCASQWPPLVLKAGNPIGPSAIAKGLTVVSGADGRQVEYNGHPLYTFTGDKSAGQAKGQGMDGAWYVMTPSTQSQAGSNW